MKIKWAMITAIGLVLVGASLALTGFNVTGLPTWVLGLGGVMVAGGSIGYFVG